MASERRDATAEESNESIGSTLGRWFLTALLIVGVLVLFAILAGGVFLWRVLAEHQAALSAVQAEVARVRARGEPASNSDLTTQQHVPLGVPDATEAWLAAFASFDEGRFNGDGKGLPFVGQGDEASLRPDAAGSQLVAAEVFLLNYDDVLRAVIAAAEHPGQCRFPVNFALGAAAPTPHNNRLRCVVRLLALNLRVKAIRGDAAEAMKSLEAMLASAAALEQQSTMLEQTVRTAILGVALYQAGELLNETQLSDQQLALLQAKLLALDVQSGLTSGLIAERALGLDSMQQQTGTSGIYAEVYLQTMSELIDASRLPFPEARDAVEQIETDIKATQTLNPWTISKYVPTVLALPAHRLAFDHCARMVAYRNLLLAAVAAERFRLESGAFPAQLAELGPPSYLPALPIDPYDGSVVRMIPGDSELTLYCLGQDKKDDGGKQGKVTGQPDLVIRLRAVKGQPSSAETTGK